MQKCVHERHKVQSERLFDSQLKWWKLENDGVLLFSPFTQMGLFPHIFVALEYFAHIFWTISCISLFH